MRQPGLTMLFIWVGIVASVAADGPPPRDATLRGELLAMEKADQEARTQMMAELGRAGVSMLDGKAITDPVKLKAIGEITAKMTAVDTRNRDRLKRIVTERGWPCKTLVGVDGAGAAFLLTQHADDDRPFQKKCLELMSKAPEGEVRPVDLAYLTDRDLVADNKRQRYGTQLQPKDGTLRALPIEDEAEVDKRRAGVGLPPLADYLRETEAEYRKLNKPPAGPEPSQGKAKE